MPDNILSFVHPADEARRRYEERLEATADLWLEALDRTSPCPVDVFEDTLAHELGLRRHPVMTQTEWRAARVAFIEENTSEDFEETEVWRVAAERADEVCG